MTLRLGLWLNARDLIEVTARGRGKCRVRGRNRGKGRPMQLDEDRINLSI